MGALTLEIAKLKALGGLSVLSQGGDVGAITAAIRQQAAATDSLRAARLADRTVAQAAREAEKQASALAKAQIAEETAAKRTAAQADKQASTEAKAALAEEARAKQISIAGFLEAVAAVDLQIAAEQRLQAEWSKEQIATDIRIAKELELGRARELSALKADIIQRSPDSLANDAAKIAQQEELTLVTQAEAAAEREKTLAQYAAAAQGSQLRMLEEQMMFLRTEDIILLDRETVSSERLSVAQNVLSESELEVLAVTRGVATARQAGVIATEEQVVATKGLVSANVSAAASLGILEGRTLSMNRAAANFLTKVLGFGPAFQSIFAIVGAVALIAVAYQAYEAFDKFYKAARDAAHAIGDAFNSIIAPLNRTNDSLAVANDNLDRTTAKLEHKPTTNGSQLAIDQIREAADRLDVSLERVQKDLDTILTKNRIGQIGGLLTGQADTKDAESLVKKQFDAIDKAREDGQQKIDAATNRNDAAGVQTAFKAQQEAIRTAAQSAIKALNDEYNVRAKINNVRSSAVVGYDDLGNAIQGEVKTRDQTANLTLLGKSASLATAELRNINLTIANIGKEATVDKLRDQVSAQKDAVKEAAAEWKQLEAAFVSYQLKIAQGGEKATPQQSLSFLQDQEKTLNPLNQPKLNAKELPFQNEIDSQKYGENQIARLGEQASNLNLYGTALKEATELDRIFQEAQQKGYTLDETTVGILKSEADYIAAGLPLQTAKTKIQKEAIAQEEQYSITLKASLAVMADHPELADAISRDLNRMKIAHDDLKDPLLEFNRGIEQSKALLGQYGNQLIVSQQVDELANKLRSEGVTTWKEQAEAQRDVLTQQLDDQQMQKDLAAIYGDQATKLHNLVIEQNALNQAKVAGKISDEAYQSASVQNYQDQRDSQNGQGQGKGSDFVTSPLTSYAKGFKDIATSLKTTLGDAFKAIADGAANTFAKIIVEGGNMGKAFKQLGQEIVESILSALIKVAIQALIVDVLFKALHLGTGQGDTTKQTIKNTAASLAAIATVTAAELASITILTEPAWNLAEAVATFSFGAAAVAAEAAIASVKAAGSVGMATGGWVNGPGTGTSDSVLRFLSDGEHVTNAASAAANSGLLNAINNSGGKQVQVGSVQGSSNTNRVSGSNPMHVEVHNYAGVQIETQQISESHVRVIATKVAKDAVYQHADAAIAQAAANPNSATRKSFKNNTTVRSTN